VSDVSASERIYRARRIGTTFGRAYLGIRANRFIAKRLRPRDMEQRWTRLHRESAESIYDTAVELRGLILKGCQFLGTRADVWPPEYVDVLSRLHDRVPAKPWSVVRHTVEGELGCPVSQVFREFAQRPMAAASLAQVHRAVLHDGRPVAVKVQYPEIEGLVRSDLGNLRMLFRAVGWLERDFDPMPLIDELATTVPEELNFANEGRNAERVAAFFAERDDIDVPAVHWELTSERVLVTDLVEGIKISDAEGLRKAGIDPDRVAEVLVEAYCEQILVHGFFHADPHPGNLLVQTTASGEPRLVFLDFGLAKDLPEHFRDGVLRFAGALLQGDVETMGRALVELGFETRNGGTDSMQDIARFVLEVGKRIRSQSHLDRTLAERLRAELPNHIRENPIVRVPSHLVLVARVVGLLSGLTRSLGTRVDLVLVRSILPYALDHEDVG
jgi:predicted unusual protein kinase regulating ubiquinone biosynthesis (AarF/ABC1/UbiB family)